MFPTDVAPQIFSETKPFGYLRIIQRGRAGYEVTDEARGAELLIVLHSLALGKVPF